MARCVPCHARGFLPDLYFGRFHCFNKSYLGKRDSEGNLNIIHNLESLNESYNEGVEKYNEKYPNSTTNHVQLMYHKNRI